MITGVQLRGVFTTCRDPNLWCSLFPAVFEEFDISTPARQNMWLAQCGYESSNFNVIRENMSYSPEQLKNTWPSHFSDPKLAQRFARAPQDLANYIYAGRNGNGDYESGDGFRYRGGGLIELTGKANYKTIGEYLGYALVERPMLIEQPKISARCAGFFWQLHGLNEIADTGSIEHATKVINGGLTGLAERTALWEKLTALNASSNTSSTVPKSSTVGAPIHEPSSQLSLI